MLSVSLHPQDTPVAFEYGPVIIGPAPASDLVVSGALSEVAILKYHAGNWILRLRDETASIANSAERRVFLTEPIQQVTITAPGYTLVLDIAISNGVSPPTPLPSVATLASLPTSSAFPDADVLVVGAAPDADIRIDDPSVELRHAVIRRRSGNVWVVADQGSVTGTFVDGEGVTRSPIGPGSLVTFGGVTLCWPDDFEPMAPVVSKHQGHARASVTFSNVTVGYPGKAQPALASVDLHFQRGRLTAIVGPSGVGKSTLCRAILGEIEVRFGDIAIDGVSRRNGIPPNPQQVSFVPQETILIESLTIRQTLEYATQARSARSRSRAQREADAKRIMAALGLGGMADRKVSKLSGGEKKRVSIAQELVTQPLALLLDEPSSGLDEGLDRDLMRELKTIARSPESTSVIVVTHATNHLDSVDDVCAIGASSVTDPDTAKSALRYVGAPAGLLDTLNAQTFADAMNALRATSNRESDQRVPSTFRQRFRSQGGLHPLRALMHREWMLVRPQILKLFTSLIGLSVVIAGLLAVVDPSGLGTTQTGDNPNLLITITMLVLLLCFWSLYKPTMRVVSDWPVTRREQRWGISARLHLLARFLWDLPQLLFVPAVTTLTLIGVTVPHGPRLPWAIVGHLVVSLWLTCICCYMLGLLIGATSRTSVGAIQLVVGCIAAMIVFSGALFYLPDVRALDIASNVIPSRLAIAELASTLNVAQAVGSDSMLDPKFYSPNEMQDWILVGIVLIGTLAAAGAAFSTARTMRKLDRKD